MRTGTPITLEAAERRRLETITGDRNAPQKHVWRARIVLLSADGVGTNAIMAATGTAKTTVWRWQERFVAEGIDGLLRDKTRPPGKAPVPDAHAARVVEMTLKPPPHEATHWTGRAMANAAGLAVSTVQRIWKAHGLARPRGRREAVRVPGPLHRRDGEAEDLEGARPRSSPLAARSEAVRLP